MATAERHATMPIMFKIHMLPAAHGDCLLVEYGTSNGVYRVVIDGGVVHTYETLRAQLEAIPEKQRELTLLVITHVDADHIEGAVKLLSDESLGLRMNEVWFNGYEQLAVDAPVNFGGVQGEYASALIEKRKLSWNAVTNGGAICVPDEGPLPTFTLPGGLQITILSPTISRMADMADKWDSEVKKAGLVPGHSKEALEHLQTKGKRLLVRFSDTDEGPNVQDLVAEPYDRDTAPANGSSIAFIAEYGGKRVLFGADAHAEVLVSSLERLLKERKLDILDLDIFKLPHHGSSANLSPRLLDLVNPKQVLVSTSGAIFEHPDAEAIARILHTKRSVDFVFNYRSEETEVWDNDNLRKQFQYTTHYPQKNGQIMTVDVENLDSKAS